MHKRTNTIENIILDMKIVQLQLFFAQKSIKKLPRDRHALVEVESHIKHSLHSLNHLITQMNDLKEKTEIKTLTNTNIKEIP